MIEGLRIAFVLLSAVRWDPAAAAPRDPSAAEAQEPDDAEEAGGAERVRELLARYVEDAPISNRFVGLGDLPGVEAELAALPAGAEQAPRRVDLLRQAGFHRLRLGLTEEAILAYGEALALAEEHALGQELVDGVRFELALAWLRQGERENCLARHTSQSCLLPIAGSGVHQVRAGSQRALELFLELHATRPRDASAAWLANLAAMTLGEWPEALPEDWRVPPEALRSEIEFPRFPEVAKEWGLATGDLSGGSVADDFDGDGVLDLVTSTWDPRGGLHFFRGLGGGRFEDRSAEAGLGGVPGGLNLVQADYDDDGDLDLFVLRGAWLGADGKIPKSLLRNEGGRFVDVFFEAGLGRKLHPSQTAAFADYDNDGDLDLYVGNEGDPRNRAPSQFFVNQGDGTFVERARELGIENGGFAKGVAWGDYDCDRWPDLYVSNLGSGNHLFKNRKGEGFRDVTARSGVGGPVHSFATWFFDYNNDGLLDLFVCSYLPTLGGVASGFLGWPTEVQGPVLYRQLEDGGFKLVKSSGFERPTCVMGANFGDLDGDGWLDVYLGTGFPGFESLMPNLMYLNQGGRRFADVTSAGGFGHLQKGHGVSFADFDQDGDQDLFIQMGGAFADDGFPDALFQNPGFGNAAITVRLRGVQSNSWGVGARIRCLITEDGAQRSIYRTVNSGGSFGANPLSQTIGLGRATVIDVLEVYWPTSDTTQTFEQVPVGGAVLVEEFATELQG